MNNNKSWVRNFIFNELPYVNMIAKMLWPLIQVNLPLMFYINEIPISSQLYKKRLSDFFDSNVKYHSPLCFSSRNIMKSAETHPPPMCDVIIKQPYQTIDWNVWGVVQQKIVNLYQFLLCRKKIDIVWVRFWHYISESWDLQNSNLT